MPLTTPTNYVYTPREMIALTANAAYAILDFKEKSAKLIIERRKHSGALIAIDAELSSINRWAACPAHNFVRMRYNGTVSEIDVCSNCGLEVKLNKNSSRSY